LGVDDIGDHAIGCFGAGCVGWRFRFFVFFFTAVVSNRVLVGFLSRPIGAA
jgi:hypothetical protein